MARPCCRKRAAPCSCPLGHVQDHTCLWVWKLYVICLNIFRHTLTYPMSMHVKGSSLQLAHMAVHLFALVVTGAVTCDAHTYCRLWCSKLP